MIQIQRAPLEFKTNNILPQATQSRDSTPPHVFGGLSSSSGITAVGGMHNLSNLSQLSQPQPYSQTVPVHIQTQQAPIHNSQNSQPTFFQSEYYFNRSKMLAATTASMRNANYPI